MAEPPLPLFPSSMPPHGFFPQHAQRNSGLVAQPLAPPAATSYPNMIPASSSQPLQPFYPPQPQYPYIPPNTKQPAFIGPTLPIPPQQQFHPGAMRPNPAAPLFHPLQSYSNSNIHPNYAMPPAAQSASPSGAPQPWQVDVYAPSFVPSYFMQINTLPAISVRSPPPWSISYPSYISSFAGTSLLQPLPPYPSIQSPTTRALSLSPSTYLPYFFDLFVKELSAQHQNARLYDMYNVPLYPHDLANFQFKLMVPGIREDCPSVQIGDMVHLRQIRSNGFNMYPPAGFTGYQYEAYIHGIDRQAGFLVLRIDDLRLESGMFNVCFLVQERIFGPHSRAVHECSKLLASGEKVGDGSFPNIRQLSVGHVDNGSIANAGIERSTYLRKMLFPEKEDGVLQTTLSKGMFKHRWFDIELNYEQQKAVDAILEQNYGTVPYLISGPPGTGKTKTIVEAALQLIFAPATQRSHILLCAPSNQAADTLAQRLIKHLSPKVLFRMNNCSRSFAEVPSELLAYCFVQNDSFALPEWRKLMSYRVVVTTCVDCSMLVQARCTNRDLARWQRVIDASLKGDELPGLIDGMDVGEWTPIGSADETNIVLHWNALLIDEAAQGTEPDVLIPLTVVTPPEECSWGKPILVMAGDQNQLGPRLASRSAGLETSLLERLFTRPLYSEHPLSRHGIAKLGGGSAPEWISRVSATLLPYIRPPFTNLVRNYRSHPAILAVPSALFYNDTLVPEAPDVNGMENWDGWRGRKWPVLFMANGGQDEPHEEGVSFYNLREAAMACRTAQRLVEGEYCRTNEIAIMSPFREQVKRLRNVLRSPPYKLRGINVGPLEAYQGSEHKFVIICTTRTRERFLEQDMQRGLGIIFESKKFNVALTRAKQGLVVIGNPWILQKDPNWLAFLSFCWRNGAVEHDPEEAIPQSCDSKGSTVVGSPNMGALDGKMSPSNETGSSTITSGHPATNCNSSGIPNVNIWQPSQDQQDVPQYLSRLEHSLILKQKLEGTNESAPKPLNAGYDDYDPMWTAGRAAEEALRDFDLVANA